MEKHRKPVIAANWKMHKTIEEVEAFFSGFLPGVHGTIDREIVIAPSFVSLQQAARIAQGSPVAIAAQNMHFEEKGAFTGEISPAMLLSAGIEQVIIGHSERRHIFGEDDALVSRKVASAVSHGLRPILCIGETLSERESGQTDSVLSRQLSEGLKDIDGSGMAAVSIAYEPVWAIGTGKTATVEQIQAAHRLVRQKIADRAGESVAESIRILYGGSVKPENVKAIMALEDVDGALVGGASLSAESFLKIVRFDQ